MMVIQQNIKKPLVRILPDDLANQIRLQDCWAKNLLGSLNATKIFNRICWLKTIAGGWTTTIRMHEEIKWSCLFGCADERDCLQHYLTCPVLWLLACSVFGGEDSVCVNERLCLRNPSTLKLQRLSLAHGIYHACKNDLHCSWGWNPCRASAGTEERFGVC